MTTYICTSLECVTEPLLPQLNCCGQGAVIPLATRLGMGADRLDAVKRHPSFQGVDWPAVHALEDHRDNVQPRGRREGAPGGGTTAGGGGAGDAGVSADELAGEGGGALAPPPPPMRVGGAPPAAGPSPL